MKAIKYSPQGEGSKLRASTSCRRLRQAEREESDRRIEKAAGSSLIENENNPEPVGIAARRQAARNTDANMDDENVINAKA